MDKMWAPSPDVSFRFFYFVCFLFSFCLLFCGFLVFASSEIYESLTILLQSLWECQIARQFTQSIPFLEVGFDQASEMMGRLATALAIAACSGPALSLNLYTTHYGGNVSSLSLTECNGTYALSKTFTFKSCGMMPSWLTYDSKTETLYCSDEGSPNGTLTSYSVAKDGVLTELATVTTIAGGVNTLEYGGDLGNSYLATAH